MLKSLLLKLILPTKDIDTTSNYYKDLLYNLFLGASQPALGAIAIIIIKQVLDGANSLVGWVQAGSMAGLLLSFYYTRNSTQNQPQKSHAKPQLLAWLCVIGCGFTQDVYLFTALVFAALLLLHISSPAQGVLYQLIYSPQKRGMIVSHIRLLQLGVAALCSWGLGFTIEHHGFAYQGFYIALGFFGLLVSLIYMKIQILHLPQQAMVMERKNSQTSSRFFERISLFFYL